MIGKLLTLSFIAGILLLGVGAWLAYEPAGFLVVGAALVIVPVLYARGSVA